MCYHLPAKAQQKSKVVANATRLFMCACGACVYKEVTNIVCSSFWRETRFSVDYHCRPVANSATCRRASVRIVIAVMDAQQQQNYDAHQREHQMHAEQYALKHANHENLHTFLFLVLFAFLIAAQIGLFLWKKHRYRSFQNVTLVS